MANSLNNFHDYCNDEERIINWEEEAAAIIRDVQVHVKEIHVSEQLQSNQFEIFINIKTLEDEKYCIRASGSGFQIAGKDYDKIDLIDSNSIEYFETPYALLTSISQGYIQSFANHLSQQLRNALISRP